MTLTFSIVANILTCVVAAISMVMSIRETRRVRRCADEARMYRERADAALRRMRRDEPLPNWRHGPGVLVGDDGHRLDPHVFGLVPGEKLRLGYVLAHPELPWPQFIRDQSERLRSRTNISVQEWTE